ncbi:hypothetical protein [Sagittula sp. SSi028]|uniref:hypothetical protein n=1 Tax=Sagittula sp. SSi028 TaxID=3400636 RepID=UPI003AF90298
MQLVTTTPIALILFSFALILGPVRGMWCLTVTFPFGAAAAVNAAGAGSIAMYDLVALAVWLWLIASPISLEQILGVFRLGEPGLPLLLLLVWMAIGAIFLPRVLQDATEIFVTVRRTDGAANVLIPLRPVGSNINQLLRMILASSMFVAMAAIFARYGNHFRVRQGMIVATAAHISLAVLNLASIAVGMPDLLDVVRTANMAMLDNQSILGLARISGGFPEASAFGFYTIGLYGYWLRDWIGENRSWFSGFFLLAILLLLLRSTSTSAYLGFFAVTALFLSWHFAGSLRRKRSFFVYYLIAVGVPLLIGLFVLAWNFVPQVSGIVDRVLVNKLSSDSGSERMSWNTQALVNFADSWGLGVGVGSVRASSWILSCLGSLGLLGTGLYLWFVGAVLLKGRHRAAPSALTDCAAALQSGAFATVLQACISKPFPNLDMPFFMMSGAATGLLVYAARVRASERVDVALQPTLRDVQTTLAKP